MNPRAPLRTTPQVDVLRTETTAEKTGPPRKNQTSISAVQPAVAVGFEPTVDFHPHTLSSSTNQRSGTVVGVRLVLTKTQPRRSLNPAVLRLMRLGLRLGGGVAGVLRVPPNPLIWVLWEG